ncbi:monocarboxylate transporter 9 [Dermacentor silvarum]|uniref:monocarboxylate transporter 9 n=1 Tax=Dermacentor silvarum TaxID=543639 RepID=UPI0021016D66|nr:monocarboxylate transporter 9 [Dermacentor silvarum]
MSPLSGRSEGSKTTATPPQDSCWSIPAVAMCASFLLCMTQSSTGYLYVLFMEKFQVNREMASWPESIIMLTQNLGGFVVTVLHSRLPIFYVTLLSASLCSAGLVGAAFAPDMKWMSVMLGGIYGTGSGASIISFTVFTMLYFDKYRATATSCKYIGWAASGLAGPLVFSATAANYGLGGSLLVGAAIALNALPLEMFLRYPRPVVFRFFRCTMRNQPAKDGVTRNVKTGNSKDAQGSPKDFKTSPSVYAVPMCEVNLNLQARNGAFSETCCDEKECSDAKCEKLTSQAPRQLFDTISRRRMSASNSQSHKGNSRRESACVSYGTQPSTILKSVPSDSSKSILEQMALFRQLAFYVLLIVYAFCDCAISMHTTTIVDYGRDKGSPLEKAKLVVTYNAAGQFAGRTLLPFASDNVAHSRCPLAVLCFVGAGTWLLLMPVVQSLPAFMALNVVLGVCQGFVTCIRCVLVNDYCGVERLPTFFGILGLTLVPLSFSGPTIIGFFRDTLGSYDNFYRMLGAVNICIAALLFVLVWRDKMRRKSSDLPRAAMGR